MMLCDYIIFWQQHRARRAIVPGSYDEYYFLLAVSISVVCAEIYKENKQKQLEAGSKGVK